MIRGKIIAWIVVGAFLAFGVVVSSVRRSVPPAIEGRDELTKVSFRYFHDASAEAGEPQLVAISLKSSAGSESGVKSGRIVHYSGGSAVPGVSRLNRLETADLWAGALPAVKPGESARFYFVAELDDGRTFTVPANAADSGARFSVDHLVRPPVAIVAIHAVFLVGSVVILLLGLYFAVLFLAARFPDKGGSRHALHKAQVLAGVAWSMFALLAIPAGVILNTQIFGASSCDVWRFGLDLNEIRHVAIAVVFACLLLYRTDLFRPRGNPRPLSDTIYAVLYLCACCIAAVASILPG